MKAVIPVRQGSQRVKNKNFKDFAGKSLLEHKIDVVKELPVDDIIINTDSEYAISLAKEWGINYHRRDAYYASSECTNSEYHHYLAENTDSDNILVAQVTAPLISKDTFIEAIDLFSNVDCNSIGSTLIFCPRNCVQNQNVINAINRCILLYLVILTSFIY